MADPSKDPPRFSMAVTNSGVFSRHRHRVTPTGIEVTFGRINGWERRAIHFRAGDTVRFHYQGHLESGSLSVELLAPDGSTVIRWEGTTDLTNDFTAATEGKYILRTTGDHASGGYRLEMTSSA